MEGKNYAKLASLIFGDPNVLSDEKELNNNREFADAVESLLEDSWDPFDMEYIAVNDFILQGKDREDFAEYIRNNAENMANQYTAKALRKLRHPKNSGQLRQYIKFKEY